MSPSTPPTTLTSPNLAGKYLTFALGRESYGIQVLKIREIIRGTDVTSIPQMPNFIRGVINLRGKIIPVIDLRTKFGLLTAESTERTCIVVVQVHSSTGIPIQIGLVVDDVEEVVNIAATDIEQTPNFGSQVNTSSLLGIAKIKGAVKTLLDVDVILSSTTLDLLPDTIQNH